MTSQRSGRPVEGLQRPRIFSVPDYGSSAGDEAVELAAMSGLVLDPWQQLVLKDALGERPDGKWAAFEVGVEVPRQNGKGGIIEARELAGLFLLGERLQIHSAHQFDTSLEAFRRLLMLIEDTPDFDRRVKRVSRAHGEEGIELKTGQRIRFRTRTKGGGRGFSGDTLYLDEAMILPESAHGALLPTLSARPNPQVWYFGSPVDQEIHEHGVVFARLRERAVAGGDPALAYFGWSPAVENPSEVTDEMARDPEVWAQGNPGLGIRISLEHVERERLSMDPRTFAVERLGVGDWPITDGSDRHLISAVQWDALLDQESSAAGKVAFSYDVSPDRAWASISAAGVRSDGLMHVEVVARDRGTAWVPGRLVELRDGHVNSGVLCDAAGPAGALLPALAEVGIVPDMVSAREHAQACGLFYDAVADDQTVRHRGDPALRAAVLGALTRSLGDAWAWNRKSSAVDITPLVSSTLALWRAHTSHVSAYEDEGLLVV